MKYQMNEELLTKYLLGESSPEEAFEVEAWVADQSANARKLGEIKIILETSKRLAEASPLTETEAWERFKSKRALLKKEQARAVPIWVSSNWLRIAAALLLFLGGAWMAYYLYNVKSGGSTNWVTLKTGNHIRIDTLPDGSIVHINKNSTLAYSGNFRSNRKVKLTGEAFFDVKHNEAEPFTVQVADVRVQDVGTAFNIKSRLHSTEVIVKNGIVNVSKNNNTVQLKAQQMVNIKAGDKDLEVKRNSDELYNYYVSGTFAANNTPLWRLVEVLNEAYGTEIRIKNNTLRNAPITVTIRLHDPVGGALNAISLTTPNMHVKKAGGTYIIN